jgi:hypothetical protein
MGFLAVLPVLFVGVGNLPTCFAAASADAQTVRCGVCDPRAIADAMNEEHDSRLQPLSIRIDGELRAALEAQARREDRPLSYLIRRALRAEAARREQQGQAA